MKAKYTRLLLCALLAALAIGVCGCSYGRATKTDFGALEDQRVAQRPDRLHSPYDLLGKRVRIVTLDGQKLTGRVAEVTTTQLAIEPTAGSSSIGGVDRTTEYVNLETIDTVALSRSTIDGKILAIAAGGAVLTCVVLFVVAVGQYGN